MQKYGGWDNAQKVAILSHGLDYKQVSVTQKDMDFANMRIANRDDILMVLGVPKTIIGVTDDVNRANAESGIYVFLSETIKPKMEKLVDVLNQFLVDDFGDDLLLTCIDPTPEDKKSLDDHYIKAHNKWMTTNEIRIAEGYEPIDGGDYIYQPINLMPLGVEMGEDKNDKKGIIKLGEGFSAEKFYQRKKEERLRDIYRRAMRGKKMLRLKENMIDKITIEVTKAITGEMEKIRQKKWTAEQKDVLWKKFDKRLISFEKKWKALIIRLWKDQKVRALDELNKLKLDKKVDSKDLGLLDLEKEIKVFVKKATPLIKTIVEEAGNLALEQVGEKSIKKDFDIEDPMTAEWIKMKAMKFGTEVNETTIAKLKAELSAGVLEGESIDELAERVERLFEMWYKGRSRTIARTETLSANNAGTVFGYEQSGVVAKKEWLATRDSRVRDSHKDMDGEQVATNKKFSNGLEYPGDPNGSPEEIINCRCTTIPILK
jgi:SPP1 gp7 family putative phage head morphogenesis protein